MRDVGKEMDDLKLVIYRELDEIQNVCLKNLMYSMKDRDALRLTMASRALCGDRTFGCYYFRRV